MSAPTEGELDALVRRLNAGDAMNGKVTMADAAEAIGALRAQLADARRFKDRAIAEACAALETMRHRNADLPPTLEQALALPEVQSLVKRVRADALEEAAKVAFDYGRKDLLAEHKPYSIAAAIRALKCGEP
jgi:ABC-type transporter Mla subunit MlaD